MQNGRWYHDVYLENGWKYEKAKYKNLRKLAWIKSKEFIVTTSLGTDGKEKWRKKGILGEVLAL